MELRRARSLVGYWIDGELVLDNYLDAASETGERNGVAVDGPSIDILEQFGDWTDPETVPDRLDRYDASSVRDAIKALAEAGLLRTRDEATIEDRVMDAWQPWGEPATFFHFGTKDTAYVSVDGAVADAGMAARREEIRAEIAADGPPPAVFARNSDVKRIYLTRAFLPLRRDFGEVLVSRRTHRTYKDEPVPLRSLSTVLHYTFAPMYFYDAGMLGNLMLRTSPCGGARHESECYVVVRNVEQIPPGVYHYSPEDHSLEIVSAGVDEQLMDRVLFSQKMITTAGFVCFLTVNLPRAMYKYRSARMLRTVLLNTGHLAQTFALCSTAVGLGPAQNDAFSDSEVESMLGIDGISETAMYVLAAGVPDRRTDGFPIEDGHEDLERRVGESLARATEPGR
ncbi:SagB/ThcOx family dehydrogenase [Nonomuraea sp. B19D2]|uniref:SagB/ThcOx family dehydrogenase n=1 Tax=Nonomuraea sp. B19D2 TaxID=3159561 RepID=UPI0032DB56BA